MAFIPKQYQHWPIQRGSFNASVFQISTHPIQSGLLHGDSVFKGRHQNILRTRCQGRVRRVRLGILFLIVGHNTLARERSESENGQFKVT
jgi:hypothetical protein